MPFRCCARDALGHAKRRCEPLRTHPRGAVSRQRPTWIGDVAECVFHGSGSVEWCKNNNPEGRSLRGWGNRSTMDGFTQPGGLAIAPGSRLIEASRPCSLTRAPTGMLSRWQLLRISVDVSNGLIMGKQDPSCAHMRGVEEYVQTRLCQQLFRKVFADFHSRSFGCADGCTHSRQIFTLNGRVVPGPTGRRHVRSWPPTRSCRATVPDRDRNR